jgi:glycosyltransferase involved in cell wall biosynthesis
MRVLHVVSCRGWSSDAYWAASISAELARAGHPTTLVCRRGTEARVIDRARDLGVADVATLALLGGVHPRSDAADVSALVRRMAEADVVHVHRGKEHWLAALANRLAARPLPIVRTRHIVQAIRPHALNRWLYGRATSLVVTVSDAIRRQCVAAELLPAERVVALQGGVDCRRFRPDVDGGAHRRALGVPPDVPLIGLVAGLRVMKGHGVVVEAARALAARGHRFHVAFIGAGSFEAAIRRAVADAGIADRVSMTGFVADPPAAIAAFDVALYAALESDGMSRALFECLAAGKPVVATRVGVAPEVLSDGETALLVPAGEPAPLAEALDRLLDDAELRRRLGAAAGAAARARFSSGEVARALAAHYAGLVSAARLAA